jgi:dihydropteroate synthase
MAGVSRKRFIGELTGRPVGERGFGTAGAVAAAVMAGADAVRVHDVGEMSDVVTVAQAIAAVRRSG